MRSPIKQITCSPSTRRRSPPSRGEITPIPQTGDEIRDAAKAVRDANYRIEVAEDGVHIYNRDGHHVAADPFALFPKLGVEADGGHAFYLGYELAKAEM